MTDQSTNDPLADIAIPDDATRPSAPILENVQTHHRHSGDHLRAIHNHHRGNMRMVHDAMLKARTGDQNANALQLATAPLEELQRNYRQFGALCGQECQMIHMHHSIEDAHMFPALSAKAQAFQNVIQRLVDEHHVVHALLVRMIEKLNALFEDPSDENFEQAQTVYLALEKLLLSHFTYEENSVGDALGVYGIGI